MPATYGPCRVRLVWGNANFGGAMPTGGDRVPGGYEQALTKLAAAGVTEIDTARAYRQGKAEEWHGEVLRALPSEVSETLTVSSKAHPMFSLRYDAVRRQATDMMALLGVGRLDIFYLHGVDPATSIEETLRAVNDLHREGVFERFGLSNYPAWQVVQVYYLCQRLGYVVPTVYQGLYNPLCRTVEYELLPALRSVGMAFYAYSPLAGGLLANSTSAARAGYRTGMLSDLGVVSADDLAADEAAAQRRKTFLKGMARLEHSVETAPSGPGGERLEVKDAALRWFFHHSQLIEGDAVVVGSSRLEQVEQLLASLSLPAPLGPHDSLPEAVVGALNDLWESLRGMPYYPNQPGAPTLASREHQDQPATGPRL